MNDWWLLISLRNSQYLANLGEPALVTRRASQQPARDGVQYCLW